MRHSGHRRHSRLVSSYRLYNKKIPNSNPATHGAAQRHNRQNGNRQRHNGKCQTATRQRQRRNAQRLPSRLTHHAHTTLTHRHSHTLGSPHPRPSYSPTLPPPDQHILASPSKAFANCTLSWRGHARLRGLQEGVELVPAVGQPQLAPRQVGRLRVALPVGLRQSL